MSKWKAQPLDVIYEKFFDNEEHDRIVRSMITFIKDINLSKMQQAIDKLLSEAPFFNTTFQEDNKKFYWNQRSEKDNVMYVDSDWSVFYDRFIHINDFSSESQIKFYFYKNIMGVAVNSMMTDIYGLKSLIVHLFEIYNNIENPLFKPLYKPNHSRDFKEFLKSIPFKNKIHKIALKKLSNENFNKSHFTFKDVKDFTNVDVWMNTDSFYKEETKKIFEVAEKLNTKVSNIFLAAYYRTIVTLFNEHNNKLNIGRQYDARNESSNKQYISFSNLHVILPNVIKVDEDENGNLEKFEETLKKVDQLDNLVNAKHLVSKKISLHPNKIFGPTEYYQFTSMEERKNDSFRLNDNQTQQIFFFTPTRNIPYLSLTVAAFNEQIYVSSINFIQKEDAPNVNYFYQWLKYEVRTFINLSDPVFFKTWNEQNDLLETYQDKTLSPGQAKNPAKIEQPAQNAKFASTPKQQVQNEKKVKQIVQKTKSFVGEPIGNKSKWTKEQIKLAKEYFKMTGNELFDAGDSNVKYKIRGKLNSFQKRSWHDIKTFINHKKHEK